ncbi:MAG: MBL fold metallo-hydrolase [Methanomicrobiales archaeon]|nr:MBL fold metallo-hydrolase [Methanomicrobiales archaeon]MDI6875361.1 MBL fold metallo-hydrolase [Methanomicrobiales archaeon]
MRFAVLASGSKANCIYIRGANDALILDAGLALRETMRRLALAGGDPSVLQGILLTHEHADHIRGSAALSRRFDVPIFGTQGTLEWFLQDRCASGVPDLRGCRIGERFTVGDFTVEPFATSHDAREPCGYRITEGGATLSYCTDTGRISPSILERIRDSDALVLESNHCPHMLRNGPYPEMLKRRIRSSRGHLSNQDARECIRAVGADMQAIVLAHLSEVNNTAEKAVNSALEGLGLGRFNSRDLYAIPGGDRCDCWMRWVEI